MKNFKSLFALSCLFVFSFLCFSCSDDDKDNEIPQNPLDTNHFDLWASAGESSGMGAGTPLVYSTKSLESDEVVDFKGVGVDVYSKLYQESIIKGQYYYQIPKEKDRFGSYKIGSENVEIVSEVIFGKNTYKDRRYSHAWLNDHTLLIMAADGPAKKIIWTKLAVDANHKLSIAEEGELVFPEGTAEIGKYSTSGITSYRKSDNKILYSYLDNNDKKRFYLAFINPTNMQVEKVVMEDRHEMMAGTAYGELLQSKSFFDTNGDYYLACSTVMPNTSGSTQQFSGLLRVKKGETDFDKSYIGFQKSTNPKGKIITAELLTTGKALLYIMDPEYTQAGGWGANYNCYYAVVDLYNNTTEVLPIPFSEGNFSQRSAVLGNKAYIGANPKQGNPCVYIYEISTGKLTKGISIKEGFSFDRIVTILD